MAKKNENYLAQLNTARKANQEAPDLEGAMAAIKEYSGDLSAISNEDLEEINDLMSKVDNLADIFDKYSVLQGKIESLQENVALMEASLGDTREMAEEADIDPLGDYTQDETYAISVQVIKEFENESRLSKDLLESSAAQTLEGEIPDEIDPLKGITKEQTVQVFMQVIAEFEVESELSKLLAYNAGVR